MLDARLSRAKSQKGRTGSRRAWVRKGRRGVSDIIGTILILAITVTLFSSIFFFVNSLPGPAAQSPSQFTATTGQGGGFYLFVNVTYTSGPVLSGGALAFYMTSTANAGAFSCHNPYPLTSGISGATTWSAGQIWSLPLTAANLCGGLTSLSTSKDNLTITIVDVVKNVVLFTVNLPGSQVPIPPIFVSEGTNPSPVSGSGPFTVYAQIKDPNLAPTDKVIANLASLPGPVTGTGVSAGCANVPPNGCTVPLTYNIGTGTWVSPSLYASALAVGSSFPIEISATDSLPLVNSATFYAKFINPQGADLQVSLVATPGNPIIYQNTTLTATISNQGPGGGVALVDFNSSTGNFCPSVKSCVLPAPLNYSLLVPISPFATGVTVQAYWNATGALAIGDGNAVVFVSATLGGSSTNAKLPLTVYPKTVLVDGSGIAQGSVVPPDPFTYLETDFNSANIPYSSIVAPPNTTTITYSGTSFTALSTYNIVIWDVGNATQGSASNTCLSSQDALAVSDAVAGGKSVWMIGGDAFSCPSASLYLSDFGVTSSSTSATVGLTSVARNTVGPVPFAGYPTGMQLPPATFQSTLTLNAGATSYLCNSACGSASNLAVAYSGSGGPTFSTSFDLATLSTTLTYGSSSEAQFSTGAQADLVYNVFNYLAGFTVYYALTNTAKNVNTGTDWAVSQVTVVPSHVSYQTSTGVFFTLRDNGIYSGPVKATLLVDGLPYPAASPVSLTISPPPGTLGGSLQGVLTWYPAAVGYVSIGVEISPPPNDSNAGNNILYNSVFNTQVYVSYSVLVVDDTLHSLSPTTYPDDTNSTILPALIGAGFNQTTINVTYITRPCQAVPVSLSQYNLVVWNSGEVVNATNKCTSTSAGMPLSDKNAGLLSSFLVNGGTRSSLLFIGGGLMTNPVTDLAVRNFTTNYLGTKLTGTGGMTPTGTVGLPNGIFGSTNRQSGNDLIGNGIHLTYTHPGTAGNYTCAPTGNGSGSFYYNFTGDSVDYWTGQTYCAGTEIRGGNGWHAAFWAFDPASAGLSANLNLSVLRAGTFFGRFLPGTQVVVAPPDITFAQSGSPWTNFDGMHPQLEQQYLIRANVTNLGAFTANNVGVNVLDGSHILGSQTLSIGGSSESINGTVSMGVGQVSISWTPLYAGINPITVQLTSGTSGNVVPSPHSASWTVVVYFFYDNTSTNGNQWTHQDNIFWQDPEDPGFNPAIGWSDWVDGNPCSSPTQGFQIYQTGDTNIPVEWPLAPPGLSPRAASSGGDAYQYSSCASVYPSPKTGGPTVEINGYTPTFPSQALYPAPPSGCSALYQTWYTDAFGNSWNVCTGMWGMDSQGPPFSEYNTTSLTPFPPCYVASTLCASLSMLDDGTQSGLVTWSQSSPITLPSYASSAVVKWWQKYTLDPSVTGIIVCVEPASVSSLSFSGTTFCTPDSAGQVVTPLPGYTGSVEYGASCTPVSVYTSTSGGGTFSWEQSRMNLTPYLGSTVRLWFGYIEAGNGGGNTCGATLGGYNGGYWVNQLQGFDSIPTGGITWSSAASALQSGSPTTTCNIQSGTNNVTQYQGQFIPPDLWHLQSTSSQFLSNHGLGTNIPSTSAIWMGAVPTTSSIELGPNMWDELNSRPIDLTSASVAQLTFQYIWEWNGLSGTPPMGFVLQVTPVSSNGVTQYVQVWNADVNSTTGAMNPSSSIWQTASVNLTGYVGQVIQLRFLVGTNCAIVYPYLNGGALLTNMRISGTTIIPAMVPMTPPVATTHVSSPLLTGIGGPRTPQEPRLPLPESPTMELAQWISREL